MNWQPIARIVIRYAAGGVASLGILAPETVEAVGADPALVAAVAALIGGAVEMIYARARKTGGPT